MTNDIEDALIRWSKEGTKFFNIDGGVITENDSFDIVTAMIILAQSQIRVAEITTSLKGLMKKHNKSIIKILRDINLEFKEYEKNFALYVLGKNFKDSFDKMSEDEKEKFLIDIAKILNVSEDKITNILSYFIDLTEKQFEPSEIIKKIVVSNFKDNEIDYMMLVLGLSI
jgi:F0F1-type ATP synthase gamma subunit